MVLLLTVVSNSVIHLLIHELHEDEESQNDTMIKRKMLPCSGPASRLEVAVRRFSMLVEYISC